MIFVDKIAEWPTGLWCHLLSDLSLEELHEFAKSIGVKKCFFHNSSIPHYDLRPAKRELAVANGAIEVKSNKQLVLVIRKFREANEKR